jgi:hypothetical protein
MSSGCVTKKTKVGTPIRICVTKRNLATFLPFEGGFCKSVALCFAKEEKETLLVRHTLSFVTK